MDTRFHCLFSTTTSNQDSSQRYQYHPWYRSTVPALPVGYQSLSRLPRDTPTPRALACTTLTPRWRQRRGRPRAPRRLCPSWRRHRACPPRENMRSTPADDAGRPRNWRAILASAGGPSGRPVAGSAARLWSRAFHHASTSTSRFPSAGAVRVLLLEVVLRRRCRRGVGRREHGGESMAAAQPPSRAQAAPHAASSRGGTASAAPYDRTARGCAWQQKPTTIATRTAAPLCSMAGTRVPLVPGFQVAF